MDLNNQIIIYGKSYCQYCKNAIALLEKYGYKYKLYNLDLMYNGDKLHTSLKISTNQVTVPYIFCNDQFIGGYTDLKEKLNL